MATGGALRRCSWELNEVSSGPCVPRVPEGTIYAWSALTSGRPSLVTATLEAFCRCLPSGEVFPGSATTVRLAISPSLTLARACNARYPTLPYICLIACFTCVFIEVPTHPPTWLASRRAKDSFICMAAALEDSCRKTATAQSVER